MNNEMIIFILACIIAIAIVGYYTFNYTEKKRFEIDAMDLSNVRTTAKALATETLKGYPSSLEFRYLNVLHSKFIDLLKKQFTIECLQAASDVDEGEENSSHETYSVKKGNLEFILSMSIMNCSYKKDQLLNPINGELMLIRDIQVYLKPKDKNEKIEILTDIINEATIKFKEEPIEIREGKEISVFVPVKQKDSFVFHRMKIKTATPEIQNLNYEPIALTFKGNDFKMPALITEEIAEAFIKEGRNIIFSGPAGTGKTVITSSVIDKLYKEGYSIISVTGTELINMLSEQSIKNALMEQFTDESKPLVFLVEDIDAVLDSIYDGEKKTLVGSSILAFLDGTFKQYVNSVVIGSSNANMDDYPAVIKERFTDVFVVKKLSRERADKLKSETIAHLNERFIFDTEAYETHFFVEEEITLREFYNFVKPKQIEDKLLELLVEKATPIQPKEEPKHNKWQGQGNHKKGRK